MKGTRPEQAILTRDTDMSKTDETRRVIESMVDGLNDHRIDDIGAFFAEGFRWMGNQGCGTKQGLKAFQDNWQRPFQAAFSDKVCIDEARLYMGEWAAAFGRQEATHTGTFLGIAPTGKRVEIRYMDFWKVEDGKITVWTNCQSPFPLQRELERMFKMPARVIVPYVGGGFGSKSRDRMEVVVTAAAKLARRPVRRVLAQSADAAM